MKPWNLALFCAVVSISSLICGAQSGPGRRPNAKLLAIVHVTLLDGTGRPPLMDQTVLISGERITKVGPSKSLRFPRETSVVDATGKFLLPGLWDMHVHVAGISADPKWSGDTLLPLLIASGITGIRDMGGDLDALNNWKREIAAGTRIGPHIIASGPFLLGRGRKSPEQYPVKNAEDARAAVRDLKQRGADFVKIISLPSPAAFWAVADEAKKQNISFAGHLPQGISALQASNAGMRSIEHLYYSTFALSVSSREAELREQLELAAEKHDTELASKTIKDAISSYDQQKAAALWRALKKNGTWVTPILAVIYRAGHPLPARQLRSDFLPAAVNDAWVEAAKDPNRETQAAILATLASNDWKLTREMHAAGVSILVGSDSLDPGMIPGPSLYLEMDELTKTGMSPMETIVAATRDAARFAGFGEECGTVSPSKYADLVLFRTDPTHDLGGALKSLDAVVLHGRYLDRTALDSLLDRARKAAAGVK
jgi:imidazolonepropionase-like amidohydrolase